MWPLNELDAVLTVVVVNEIQLVNWHINVASASDSEDLAVVITEDVLSLALNICIGMYAPDSHASVAVSSTALATIRQLINLMTTEAAKQQPASNTDGGGSDMNSCAQCLYLFIQDICMIGRGEPGMWMNGALLSMNSSCCCCCIFRFQLNLHLVDRLYSTGVTAPPSLAWEVLSELLLHYPELLTSTDTFRSVDFCCCCCCCFFPILVALPHVTSMNLCADEFFG